MPLNFGIGAVLSGRDVNSHDQVIGYASNRVSKTESRYPLHYTRQFSHYLIGRKFIFQRNHKSLTLVYVMA